MHRDGRYGPCRSLSPPVVKLKGIIGDAGEDVSSSETSKRRPNILNSQKSTLQSAARVSHNSETSAPE